MQDTIEQPLRRATDGVARKFYDKLPNEGSYISNEHAALIHSEIDDIKRKLIQIDTAFLRDDISGIDYPGHRTDHLDRRKSSAIINEYKVSATKIIIGLIVTFLVGIMSSGLINKVLEIVSQRTA